MLKPLEARIAADGQRKKERQRDITTYRLNQPRGHLDKNLMFDCFWLWYRCDRSSCNTQWPATSKSVWSCIYFRMADTMTCHLLFKAFVYTIEDRWYNDYLYIFQRGPVYALRRLTQCPVSSVSKWICTFLRKADTTRSSESDPMLLSI